MDLTRKQVIDLLEKADSTVYKEPKTKLAQALEYAISSLKTDEAYQLMYEGEEVYTKADMVAMLTEIQLELDEMKITKVRSAGFAPYSKDQFRRGVNCSKEIIQQKINALKEASDA